MDPRRAMTERNMLPQVGPRFYRTDGKVMFEFVVDTSNVIGPRPASRADQEKHAGAWAVFTAAEGVSALDRDASGKDGGSLPLESPEVVAVQELSTAIAEVKAADVAPPGTHYETADGQRFGSLSEAAQHVAEPRQKRKYTRRQGA